MMASDLAVETLKALRLGDIETRILDAIREVLAENERLREELRLEREAFDLLYVDLNGHDIPEGLWAIRKQQEALQGGDDAE
jgi:hypothetical protein